MLEMNCHHLRVQMFFMRTHPPPHREPGVQIPWGSGKTQTRSPGSTQLRLGNSCPPTGLYCLPALATAVSSSHLAWSPHQRPTAGPTHVGNRVCDCHGQPWLFCGQCQCVFAERANFSNIASVPASPFSSDPLSWTIPGSQGPKQYGAFPWEQQHG